ncbi:MAG: LysR substrate-binding domain-containing protein [Neisseria sp.]|uniref:LysR substrate-binding domain-containing protein n=1 Tax=Neisseria sp. TaxID=192066 RepID=UPI0026DDCC8E|nr:LysR substrate-binding domain-containing protein [Neisseria sp.]MDO4249035.1 LysR substrate-binding domain-containing protein [Neisseria sp.]
MHIESDSRNFKVKDIALNRIKLRPLIIFNQVHASGSIIHAANELHLTQPAVTKAIHELEDQLQVKLFIRKKSGVEPTEEGRFLAKRINHLLIQLRYLVDDINSFREGHVGRLAVGTLLSGSVHLLPRAVVALKKSNPDVHVTIKVGTFDELFPALSKGELDIVVGRLPKSAAEHYQFNLQHTALFQEKLKLVVSKNHPLLKQQAVKIEDLLQYPWIVPLHGSEMRQTITHFFYERNLSFPANIIESMSMLANISILTQSQTIACMADHVADYLVSLDILKTLSIPLEYATSVGYSIRSHREQSLVCHKFIQIMHQLFDLDGGGF